ncbi:MAG TPA: CU044_5270 family protein [Mycobacteriales bacterium]|nr:CU044_5270 family protein [Mycobacteriales bacterium]
MNTIQPHSNDRDELVRLLPQLVERDLPSRRQVQIQEFVMTEIHTHPAPRRHPHRRLVLATSALAAVAVAAAAAVAVVAVGGSGVGQTPGGSPTRPAAGPSTPGLTPVARTFDLAASYAAARPFTPPRPDQWIYIQDRYLNPSSLGRAKGQQPAGTLQTWIRADGRKKAEHNSARNGALETWDQVNEYPALANLPTDPRQLLARLRAELLAPPTPGPRVHLDRADVNERLFGRIADILSQYLLPPAVTAALWRAAALVPGVTQAPGAVKVDGRPVIAVGRIQQGWLAEQLLVDPDTYEFVGYRSVAAEDHTIDTGGGRVIKVKKGEVQSVSTRLVAAIVDRPGLTS